MIQYLLWVGVAFSRIAVADPVSDIPELGSHYRIFSVEKNINPLNILIVYTKLDDSCRLQTDPENRDEPTFDFYWLIDGTKYKPVNSLIKGNIRSRLELDTSSITANSFSIRINDLKEMETDIVDPRLVLASRSTDNGNCAVEGRVTLGPSDENKELIIESIYTEGRSFPPAVYSVTLKGVEAKTGKPYVRKYLAKE